ncbi:MAG: hypothetical protein COV36_01895 [Alphaproteobacteria bacterium CG11_big_fil_rev_8_21_14_0_20_44_7]|nr:MAG: hypothetical protein COV36_01895 [Alphaproteobacteria bacterium CG11_big_fil_rev_8_21_14_0_20_44_7]
MSKPDNQSRFGCLTLVFAPFNLVLGMLDALQIIARHSSGAGPEDYEHIPTMADRIRDAAGKFTKRFYDEQTAPQPEKFR